MHEYGVKIYQLDEIGQQLKETGQQLEEARQQLEETRQIGRGIEKVLSLKFYT